MNHHKIALGTNKAQGYFSPQARIVCVQESMESKHANFHYRGHSIWKGDSGSAMRSPLHFCRVANFSIEGRIADLGQRRTTSSINGKSEWKEMYPRDNTCFLYKFPHARATALTCNKRSSSCLRVITPATLYTRSLSIQVPTTRKYYHRFQWWQARCNPRSNAISQSKCKPVARDANVTPVCQKPSFIQVTWLCFDFAMLEFMRAANYWRNIYIVRISGAISDAPQWYGRRRVGTSDLAIKYLRLYFIVSYIQRLSLYFLHCKSLSRRTLPYSIVWRTWCGYLQRRIWVSFDTHVAERRVRDITLRQAFTFSFISCSQSWNLWWLPAISRFLALAANLRCPFHAELVGNSFRTVFELCSHLVVGLASLKVLVELRFLTNDNHVWIALIFNCHHHNLCG